MTNQTPKFPRFFLFVLILVALFATACGPAQEIAEAVVATPTMSVEQQVAATVAAMSTPKGETSYTSPTAAPAAQTAQPQTTFCGQARDLGPWAPTSDGIGETFEVTSTLDDSTGIVLGLWFPDGNTPWGQKEITTFIEPGLSIEVQNGAGRGFDYPVGCSTSEVDSQLADHMVQRKLDTKYNGFVDVDELIRLGLVKVRFDRRDQ